MWCSTECWDCEDKKCEHYISKTELYFENQQLKYQLQQKENKEKEIKECIKEFLCTEEYIKVDGEAIANNYYKLLEILDKEVN